MLAGIALFVALLAYGLSTKARDDSIDQRLEDGKTAAAPGVEVLSEPADQFWGVRDAAVRDPAGNMIRIEQG